MKGSQRGARGGQTTLLVKSDPFGNSAERAQGPDRFRYTNDQDELRFARIARSLLLVSLSLLLMLSRVQSI